MIEIVLGCLIASNFFMMVGMWYQIHTLKNEIRVSSSEIKRGFNETSFALPSLEDIREDLIDVISNMRTPTALDHAAGVFSQIMMMRERSKIDKLNAPLVNNGMSDSDDYGTP